MINGTSTISLTPDNSFTLENAFDKIQELLPEMSETDAKMGAEILLARKSVLRDLNGPFTTVFIHKQLANTIQLKLEKENQPSTPILHAANMDAQEKAQTKISAKANINIKKFLELSGSDEDIEKRMNEFVITLGLPDLPRRHPGVDDSYHPKKNMDEEHLDLLERSHVTLQCIKKNAKKNKTKACPKLIFLRCKVDESDDPLTQQIHTGHTLSDFAQTIIDEKQYAPIFHFAGHGNAEKIGMMTQEKRFAPEQLAEHFNGIVEDAGLKKTLQNQKKSIEFHFDVCNAAYIEITDKDDVNTIKAKVQEKSVIGRFAKAMKELGYTNIVVHGYRGFYVSMANGAGIRIIDSLANPDVEISGEKALHTITVKGNNISVTLPKQEKYYTFPVTMLPTTPEVTLTLR